MKRWGNVQPTVDCNGYAFSQDVAIRAFERRNLVEGVDLNILGGKVFFGRPFYDIELKAISLSHDLDRRRTWVVLSNRSAFRRREDRIEMLTAREYNFPNDIFAVVCPAVQGCRPAK